MKHRLRRLLALPGLGLALACAEPMTLGDLLVDRESSPTVDPAEAVSVPGGGVAGGQLDGRLWVTVMDAAGAPVADAVVRVLGLEARTDALGRAAFEDGGLASPVDVHVFHPAHRYQSFYGVAGTQLTAVLGPLAPPVDGPPRMVVATGTVTGWDRLPPNRSDRARVATVLAVGVPEAPQAPRPGTVTPSSPAGSPGNLLVEGDAPFPSWTDYTLRFDERARAVVVFGGTFTLDASPAFAITHLGVRLRMDARGSDRLVRRHLELSHPLDQTLRLELSGRWPMPEERVLLGLALPGDAGVVRLADQSPEGGAVEAAAPELVGDLEGARYYARVELRDASEPGAEVVAERLGDAPALRLDAVLPPLGRPSAAGRALAVTPSAGAELHRWRIEDPSSSAGLWEIVVFGDAARVLSLPPVPEGARDPLLGERVLVVEAFDLDGLDPADVALGGLEARAASVARHRARVGF